MVITLSAIHSAFKKEHKMTGNLIISMIFLLSLLVLLAALTTPWRNTYRNRWWEKQLASEKPFQMGDDPRQPKLKQSSPSKDL
jgi:hypothetical protein